MPNKPKGERLCVIMRKMKIYSYSVIFEPCGEGGYNVIVPAIPEICTCGKNLREAKAMAKEAIKCFLESAIETGEDIPKDIEPLVEKIAVSI